MINIILFLIILSIFLYFCSPLLKNNEGLDNCDTPPIKGSTSTDITNSHQISTLQQQLSDLDSHLRQQVSTNTAQINNIDTNIKGLNELRQIVANLSSSIKTTELGIQQLGQQLQSQANSVANQPK
jgi:hypothetical protein